MQTFELFEQGRVEVGEGVHIVYRRGGSGAPVVLVHGWPQHSLMWHAIAPQLAERFTVICPDLRGAGASTITRGGYDKTTMAQDLHVLVEHLELGSVNLAGYDLGAGVAGAYARQFRDAVRRLAVMEFALPGFGFEQQMTPQPDWTLADNWHLALFSVPEAAEWLCAGRERQLLAWFFWHLSYAGGQVNAEHFEDYVRQVGKPGALRAGIEYYAAVFQDARDNLPLRERPLEVPTLALGGEASSGPALTQIWSPVARNLRTQVIPRAGHWLGDENPQAVVDALAAFFGESLLQAGKVETDPAGRRAYTLGVPAGIKRQRPLATNQRSARSEQDADK